MKLNWQKLSKAAEMLKALAHPTRIAIIDLLENGKQLTVTEIFETLKIEQAVASHHLRILRDKELLDNRKDGKKSYYYLKHERLSRIIECIEKCNP